MKRISKLIFIFILITNMIFTSSCWNYNEINEKAIVSGAEVEYDEQKDKFILVLEVVKPMIAEKELKLKPQIIKQEGKNFFDSIRNSIEKTGKKALWSHTKVFILGKNIINNERKLLTFLDMVYRDAEIRSDTYILVSREDKCGEILQANAEIQDITSYFLENMIKNYSTISKYREIPVWEFVEDLEAEGISPTLPTVELTEYRNKKISIINGTAVFKGAKKVGWLNGNETKWLLFVIDEIKGGSLVIKEAMKEKDGKISLEIFDNKTKIKPIISNNEITMKIDIETEVNINELESEIDFIDKKTRSEIEKNSEKQMKKYISDVIEKVQKEYKSDIFGFGSIIAREKPEEWEKLKNNWNDRFSRVKTELNVKINIRGSALRSKPIEVNKE